MSISRKNSASPGESLPASPLTGNGNVVLIRSFSAAWLIERWREEYRIDITAELAGHDQVHLYRCLDTHLEFFHPSTICGSDGLYAQLARFPWYYLPTKWEHDRAMEDLQGLHRILEVGCGRGDFLDRLARDQAVRPEGLEINAEAVREACRRGLSVAEGRIEDFVDQRAGQYDAVCAFQVLEHTASPGSFLIAMARLARPGGRIILATPNPEAFLKYDDACLLDLPPHHLTRWPAAAYHSLCGLLPVEMERLLDSPLAGYHAAWYLALMIRRWLPSLRVANSFGAGLGLLLARAAWLRNRLTGMERYVCFRKTR